ncbi:MAG: tRNA pseudouridine(55) synthase TruB [Clostridia bacterium]|jgi:tRNA pseudouridine55 synthase|nr:tRNA pseudouridine(55) synthase TruB [Clostridia bacterium]MDD4275406.1 tRNA pseudouridine(55) synthase TruB [Clostridia bacterium]
MHGFINVLKPTGCTSAAIVGMVKRTLKVKSVGHMGTLDPYGTGVLPIAIGKSAKLFNLISEKHKTYRAIFSFGWRTDTIDSEGVTIFEGGLIPTENDITEKLTGFLGDIMQVPPMYSAIKIDGKRAYDLARAGKEFEISARKVHIYDFKLLEKISEKSYLFEIVCSTGTYIRSLCYDLATSLGTFAVMTAIIRTKSGLFDIQNSVTLEKLKNGKFEIIPTEDMLQNLISVPVTNEEMVKLVNGMILNCKIIGINHVKIMCNNKFAGLGELTCGKLKLKINFLQ